MEVKFLPQVSCSLCLGRLYFGLYFHGNGSAVISGHM